MQRNLQREAVYRPVLQIASLTDDQREQIEELHQQHRARMNHLRTRGRSGRVDADSYQAARKELFEEHQAALREVLTSEQWEELQSFRMDRRLTRRDQQTSYHVTRMRLIAEDLELDQEKTEKLTALVQSHQAAMNKVRRSVGQSARQHQGSWRRNTEMRREILKQQLVFQDQVREMLSEEDYLEWRMMWAAGGGNRGVAAGRGSGRNVGTKYGMQRRMNYGPGVSGQPCMYGRGGFGRFNRW